MSDQNSSRTQELLLLGQIHGLVQGLKDSQDALHNRLTETNQRIDRQGDETRDSITALDTKLSERMDVMDDRLRAVERKSAVMGAAAGGVMSVGMALIVEGLKRYLHLGG